MDPPLGLELLEPELLLPLVEPAVPELSLEPLVLGELGVVLGELGVVLGELGEERGSVSPRRPCGEVLSVEPGDALVLVLLPALLPPPLFLQAPTPMTSAAADAKAMNVRSMVFSW